MLDDVGFEFVFEGEPVIALTRTECAWLAENLVGNALGRSDPFILNVMNGLVNVIQCCIMTNLINSLDTLNQMLTGESELTFHGQRYGIGDGLGKLLSPCMGDTGSLLFEGVVSELDDGGLGAVVEGGGEGKSEAEKSGKEE